jgi:hypothetical protein
LKNGGWWLPTHIAAIALISIPFLASNGCVNRGQRAPDGGVGGSGGRDTGPGDASRDHAGGGPCAADAGMDAASCTATFSFESCSTYGLNLNEEMFQEGIQSFSVVSAPAFCGGGALRLDINLMGQKDAGAQGHGEIFLPLGGRDLSGKILTVHVMADPATTISTRFNVIAVTPTGYSGASISLSPIPAQWTTRAISMDSFNTDVTMIDRLSIQVNNITDNYAGTVYIDEIDITTAPPDGGSDAGGDGAVDAADIRDSGTVDSVIPDVRDATGF